MKQQFTSTLLVDKKDLSTKGKKVLNNYPSTCITIKDLKKSIREEAEEADIVIFNSSGVRHIILFNNSVFE